MNKKPYGSFATIDELVSAFSQSVLPKGWPVQLTHTLDQKTNEPIELKLAKKIGASVKAKTATTPTAVTIEMGGGGSTPKHASWYYPVTNGKELSRGEAVSKIADANGEYPNGRFVIREHQTEGSKGEWVLTVAYRGKPTHHHILQGPSGTL